MPSIGLDVGTGFVKCVSDSTRARFPSLYAYRRPSAWEEGRGIVEAVGDGALGMAGNPDTVLIRPVVQGSPVNERGFAELVRHAIGMVTQERHAVGRQQHEGLHVVAGLPYGARSQRDPVRRMVARLCRSETCHVVPQAIGTLVDSELEDAVIVSIGQGTTEIVAFQGRIPVSGVSSHHAAGEISSRVGSSKTAYVDCQTFQGARARPLVGMLADSICDELSSARQGLGSLPVVISGGGILIPGMREAIESRISCKAIIPKDPVMSNALGLYRLASEAC